MTLATQICSAVGQLHQTDTASILGSFCQRAGPQYMHCTGGFGWYQSITTDHILPAIGMGAITFLTRFSRERYFYLSPRSTMVIVTLRATPVPVSEKVDLLCQQIPPRRRRKERKSNCTWGLGQEYYQL